MVTHIFKLNAGKVFFCEVQASLVYRVRPCFKKHSISTVNKHSTISMFLGCVSAIALVQKCLCRGQREQSWVHSPAPQLLYVHKEDALSTGESNTDPEPASEGGDISTDTCPGPSRFYCPMATAGAARLLDRAGSKFLLLQCTCGHGWAT